MDGPDAVIDTTTAVAHELSSVSRFGAVAPGGAEVAHVRRLGEAGCDLAITGTLTGETRSLRSVACGAVLNWGSQGLWLIESSEGTTVTRIAPETGEVQARTRTRLTMFPIDVAANGTLRLLSRYESGPQWATTIALNGRLTRRRLPDPVYDLHYTAGTRVAFARLYTGEAVRYALASGKRRILARGCTTVSAG